MAATALTSDVAMVKAYCAPGAGVMAGVAFVIGLGVADRHAGGGKSVMTGFTGADNRAMIDVANAGKADRIMAIVAYGCTQYMSGGFARCDIAIVAAVT